VFAAPKAPANLTAVVGDGDSGHDAPHALTITWQPPLHPNGQVTHYRIVVRRLSDDVSTEVNYCPQDEIEEPPDVRKGVPTVITDVQL
jgi:hypothetical protein